MHGREGHFHEFADFVSCPSRSCFLLKYMAKHYINHIGTYNDHSKTLTINTTSTDLTSIVRSFMAEDVEPETVEQTKEAPYIPPVPREGDYNGVRLYIEERKRYDEQFKDFCSHHNRKELCTFLTKEFGWFVDDKSLGKNISRNI